MTVRERVIEDIEAIVKARDWLAMRSYFRYWKDEDELAEKVIAWCRFFLPHYFTDETPDFHYELVKYIFSDKNEFFAVPRGFAKTSIIQGCYCYIAAHSLRNFCVVVEKTYTEAGEVLAAIRNEFSSNEAIREVYGLMVAKDDKGNDPDKVKDAEGDFLINGVRFRGKGMNAPIRGLKSAQYRPDLITCDDCETDEQVRNEEQRRKLQENYSQGIVPAVDIGGSIKVSGTILHNDSLLKNLIDQHKGRIYRAFDPADPENTLLWGARWTYARLMERKEQMESEGLGSGKFSQEYLNEPLDDSSRRFHWDWLQHRFKDSDNAEKARNRYICFDVADAKGEKNDWTGMVVVDWDSDNFWRVVHAKQRRVDILELIDWIFEAWSYWKPNKIGCEKNAYAYQIEPLLKQRSMEVGIFPIVEELPDGGRSKEARIIGALQGRLESGKILFREDAKDDTGILIGQAYDFPRGKHDDLLDALAYVSDIGTRPFTQGRTDLMPALQRDMFDKRKKALIQNQRSIINRL